MNLWLFFFGLVILETWADVYAKKFGMDARIEFFIASLLLYLVANASWLFSMKAGMPIWRGVVLFGIAQAVTGIMVGVWMGESINIRQWIGIVVGIVSILLIVQE
jgi:drug/metabolite transporter (DMT)-like permease